MKSRILLRNEIALNSQKKKGKSQEKIKNLKYKIRVRRKILSFYHKNRNF